VSGWSELAALQPKARRDGGGHFLRGVRQGRPKIHCRQVKPSEEFLGFARNAFDATLELAGLRE